jgi:hypothetical protein
MSNNKNYYQVSYFSNPKTKLYHIRKFVIKSDTTLRSMKNYYVDHKTYSKLLNTKKEHEYKVFAVYNLKNVKYPNINNIFMRISSNLENNYNYTGFAPF